MQNILGASRIREKRAGVGQKRRAMALVVALQVLVAPKSVWQCAFPNETLF